MHGRRRFPAIRYLVTAAVIGIVSTGCVTLGAFSGVERDKPHVWDGRSFDSQGSIEPLLGGSVGLRVPKTDRVRVELEAAYARRSFASSAFVTDTPVRAEFLELGVLSVWRVRDLGAHFRVSAVGGPQVGCRLTAHRRFRDVDDDVANEIRETDVKLTGGVRLSRRMGRGELRIDGRLSWGLTNLDDTNQQSIYARTLGVRIGYAR